MLLLTQTLQGWRRSALERAAEDIGMPLQPALRERIAHEQFRMVLLHTRLGTLAATAFALLWAWQLQSDVPAPLLRAWVVMKLLVALARTALALAHERVDETAAAPWQRAMLLLLAVDGAVWGLAGWQMAGASVPLAAVGVAALVGVSCVATFGLQARLSATAAYVVPMLLPMVIGLALRGDGIAHFSAAGMLLLLVLLLATSRATSRRLAQGLLLRLRADALAAEKDAALRLARERSAERDRFLAKVSHELRTPLHGILGLTRLMHLSTTDPVQNRRLELIESSGTHLQGLINDLLEIACIEAGQFVLRDEPFELVALLEQLSEVFLLRAAERGLRLQADIELPRPHWVRGDAARLRQVLHNLVGNAIKFTDQGLVTLRVSAGSAPERVRFSVQDTGAGMADEDLVRIFQPFQQAQAGQLADGVGLGLTIAREIAVAMGGDVTAHSQRGQGSTFSFEARLPPVASPVATAAPAEPDTRLPKLVLVAEDDDVNALIVGTFLESLGVRSERVPDGRQAVQRALSDWERPDLVLMDCRMPVMDGLAATAEIRLQERARGLPRVPILALTAATADSDRLACLAAGMDQVLGKPFTRAQLVLALHAAA